MMHLWFLLCFKQIMVFVFSDICLQPGTIGGFEADSLLPSQDSLDMVDGKSRRVKALHLLLYTFNQLPINLWTILQYSMCSPHRTTGHESVFTSRAASVSSICPAQESQGDNEGQNCSVISPVCGEWHHVMTPASICCTSVLGRTLPDNSCTKTRISIKCKLEQHPVYMFHIFCFVFCSLAPWHAPPCLLAPGFMQWWVGWFGKAGRTVGQSEANGVGHTGSAQPRQPHSPKGCTSVGQCHGR